MKIVKLSQTNDREAWLDMRRGKIGGSDAKGVYPLKRGTDRTPIGVWKLVAERLSIAKDGENVMDRGHRLENEGLIKTAAQFGIELDLDPGMWISDVDPDMSVSPDAAEPGDKPTYAAENKSLDSHSHLRYIALDRRARVLADYRGYDYIPDDYKHQVVQYFAVNEYLQELYFTLYDDRIAVESLMHYVILITRNEILDEIAEQVVVEKDVLLEVRKLVKELLV